MGTETIETCPSPPGTIQVAKATPEYLQELLKDKRQLQTIPGVFHHVEKLLENEINRVRFQLFHINGTQKKPTLDLPDAEGPTVTLQDKVWIPVKDNPNYNFVGRLLGPRGMTAKQFEYELGCKIMIRGKGSMRDKKKEEQNRGKPNWEHLAEELHVLICVEDTQNRADLKLRHAVTEISRFLDEAVRTSDGEDEIKKRQLMELAIMNGTYRDNSKKAQSVNGHSITSKGGQITPTSVAMVPNQANKQPLMPQPLTAAALGTAMNPLLRAMAPNAAATGSPIVLAASAPRLPAPGQLFSPEASMAFPYHSANSLGASSATDYQYLLAAAQSAVPSSAGLIAAAEYPSNPALVSIAGSHPFSAAAAVAQAGHMDAQAAAAAAAGSLKARTIPACATAVRPHPYVRPML